MYAPRASAEIATATLARANLPVADQMLALIVSAYTHLRLGQIEAGEGFLTTALHVIGGMDESPRKLRLSALLLSLRAMAAWFKRDFSAAIQLSDQALQNPERLSRTDQIILRFWRATTYLGHGKSELAFADFFFGYDELRAKNPGFFAVLQINLGAILVHAGDLTGAESSFREALANESEVQMDGFRLVARCNLAYTCLMAERTQEARRLIDEALQIDRAYVLKRHAGDLYATIAENLIETGHLDAARTYVDDLLASHQATGFRLGTGTARYCAGRLMELSGQPHKALSDYAAGLRLLRRTSTLAHRWKLMRAASRIYEQLGDYRRSLRWQKRFHAAWLQWDQQSRPIRLAYAHERIELETTRQQRDTLAAEKTRLSQTLEALEAAHVELQVHNEKIEELQRELQVRSSQDPLTGVLNRREMMTRLKALCARPHHDGDTLVIGMMDLDHFKALNDQFGHAVGDAGVIHAARLLEEYLGRDALVCRFGGDEFSFALFSKDVDETSQQLSDMLGRMAEWRPEGVHDRRQILCASIGLAVWGRDGAGPEMLLDAADTALYRAKKGGRGFVAL
jgi:diguanylate cyclase (GGDEF)-like protein